MEVLKKKNNYLWCCLFLVLLWASISSVAAGVTMVNSPNCQTKCGDVEVPYPFGIDDQNCAISKDIDEFFLLNCNTSTGSPKLMFGELEVLNIDVANATMKVVNNHSFDCYNENGNLTRRSGRGGLRLSKSTTLSDSENKLFAFGCDTQSFIFNNHTYVYPFNPCGYAFLADQNSFDISKMRLDSKPEQIKNTSVVLDWVVGNQTCQHAQSNSSSYVCGENSNCYYSDNGGGYQCRCKQGYEGNPYLKQGCQDIDECSDPNIIPHCKGCKNIPGNYTCKCPLGMHGDGKNDNCQGFRFNTFATAIAASLLSMVTVLLIFYDYKRRKREKIFKQNGGLLLKNQRVRIFTKAELVKATNNYNQSNFIGQGGFASVYKGVVILNETNSITNTSTQLIAVKKPKLQKDDQNKSIQINHQQFHEEIAIVSQVNHKNVVKLLGLCLETKIPLLVYELVPNGTLSQHIHAKGSSSSSVIENKGEKYVSKIVDPNVVYEENHEIEIETVAELAMKCLEGFGERRPTMKEVAEELVWLNKGINKGSSRYYNNAQQNNEETNHLLIVDHGDQSSVMSNIDIKNKDQIVEYTTFDMSGYDGESSMSLH
ncbi:hypothetical protein CsatB_002008 [Cannabis sativa]